MGMILFTILILAGIFGICEGGIYLAITLGNGFQNKVEQIFIKNK